jgi:hypothetical protein
MELFLLVNIWLRFVGNMIGRINKDMTKTSLFNRKSVKFLSCESFENRLNYYNLHKKAINLCQRHGAVFDLATSDVVIYVQKCSKKLELKLMQIYSNADRPHRASFLRRGKEIMIF